MTDITALLQKVQAGEAEAREVLFAAAYPMLERLARARLRDGGRNTLLDTGGLVHESYLRYIRSGELRAQDRRAFFAFASQVMRSVIVSSARERAAKKRGAGQRPLTLSADMAEGLPAGENDILRVHDALESLAHVDARLAQLVQMRYFGGYSEQEIAETLDVNERTVQRLWLKARLMLRAAIEEGS